MDTARRELVKAGRVAVAEATRLRGGERMLPTFLIVGAQKAGTTSLYDYLTQHPQVRPALTKEVHFFDRNYGRGWLWYAANFPPAAAARDGGGPPAITGESTPYYLFHPTVAERIAHLGSVTRIVVLVRDPVERAISHHNHSRVHGFEPLPLAEAVAAEDERLAGEEERLVRDPLYVSYAHQHYSYVGRGLYLRQLERYWERFGRERVLVVGTEELQADPAATYARVVSFLDLPPFSGVAFRRLNARTYERPRLPEQGALEERFAEPNEALFAALGRRFPWRS